jgi:cyclopropane fatty-acyl-phospholipid synthase-like methyltransferase
MNTNGWDRIYRTRGYKKVPWHSGQPDRHLVRLVNEGKINKGRVLDMCSGDGTNSIYLASRGFEVYGVDVSGTAVRIARERCRKRKLACVYEEGNVLEPSFKGPFDFIFDRGCFHHISAAEKPEYVKVLKRLLRPGGRFFLLCFSDKNPPLEKNLTKEDIRGYFGRDFRIHYIKDSVHREPPAGNKRHLYASFMELL